MRKLAIYTDGLKYEPFDDTRYYSSEVNVGISSVQFGGAESDMEENARAFLIKLEYRVENNNEVIFTFTGETKYVFPIQFATIHFLSFLAHYTIEEFLTDLTSRAGTSKLRHHRFFMHTVGELFDNLYEVHKKLREDSL